MRWTVPLLVVACLAAGCLAGPTPGLTPASLSHATAPTAGSVPVTCLVTDARGVPLADATCRFAFGTLEGQRSTSTAGRATVLVPNHVAGSVDASAPGLASAPVRLAASGPALVRFALTPGNASMAAAGAGLVRSWGAPVNVTTFGNEPQMAAGPNGTLYVTPLNRLFRSVDWGRTWTDITPQLPQGAPTDLTDTSLDVGPHGTLWFARDWPYAGPTQACASRDRGTTWTCDPVAIPGATDRMWVLGLGNGNGFVQTNEGILHPVWARTSDGSRTYVPWATESTVDDTANGNMVLDSSRHAVWQMDAHDATLRLWRIDTAKGLVTNVTTTVPDPLAIPSLAAADGTLWTTGEVTGNHTEQVVAARSTDGGVTWTLLHVADLPAASTFGYVAALPGGRVAVAYYGSDRAGAPNANGGNWSTYVATTSDGNAPHPTWTETRVSGVIHHGSLCIGLGCASGGSDANARFAGDLLGVTLDPTTGNAHVAYVRMPANGPTTVQTAGQNVLGPEG